MGAGDAANHIDQMYVKAKFLHKVYFVEEIRSETVPIREQLAKAISGFGGAPHIIAYSKARTQQMSYPELTFCSRLNNFLRPPY